MEIGQTVVVGRDLFENVGVFFEIVSVVNAGGGPDWTGTFNTGLTVAFDENRVLDLGVFIGLNSHADDFTGFIGFTRRY